MATQRLHVVTFGSTQAGLSTVGYTTYNPDGTVFQARSTAGVVEFGTSTGIYGSNITLPESANIVILWDTGTSPARYAVEESRNQLNQIQEGTDITRIIWNTLKNQGDVFARLNDKISAIKSYKDYEDKFKEIMDAIDDVSKEFDATKKLIASVDSAIPSLDEIKKSLTVVVDSKSITIPDYTKSIELIKNEIKSLGGAISTSIDKSAMDVKSRVSNDINGLASIKGEMLKIISKIDGIKIPQQIDVRQDISGVLAEVKASRSDLKPSVDRIVDKIDEVKSGVEENHGQVSKALINIWKKIVDPTQMAMSLFNSIDSARMRSESNKELEKIRRDLGING